MLEKIAAATFALSIVLILALSSKQLVGSYQHTNGVVRSTVSFYSRIASSNSLSVEELKGLEATLRRASIDNRTVLLAMLNKAWAEGGMFDNFISSFHTGEDIVYLLDHLVVISFDPNAHTSCLEKHKRCFNLSTPGIDFSQENTYMTGTYLESMKRKVQVLGAVLQLGFDFIFTDMDIVWFRSPFKHFSKDADIDISCNHDFNGRSSDLNNQPNGGLLHVRSNERSIRFYEYWYQQLLRYPEKHDQDVLNVIKFSQEFQDTGVRIKFVPTDYLAGYCRLSTDMEKVCTMHAICCIGQEHKLAGLRDSIEDWKLFKSMTPQESRELGVHFRSPRNCM